MSPLRYLCVFLLFTCCYTARADNWSDYASHLENCTPGQFLLPDPLTIDAQNPLFMTYKIMGRSSRVCIVKIRRQIAITSPPAIVHYTCQFSEQQLPVLVEGVRKRVEGNNISRDDPANKIMSSACTLDPDPNRKLPVSILEF